MCERVSVSVWEGGKMGYADLPYFLCIAYAVSTEADLFADQIGVFEIATSNSEKYMRQV